jgi:hypothetical protein
MPTLNGQCSVPALVLTLLRTLNFRGERCEGHAMFACVDLCWFSVCCSFGGGVGCFACSGSGCRTMCHRQRTGAGKEHKGLPV